MLGATAVSATTPSYTHLVLTREHSSYAMKGNLKQVQPYDIPTRELLTDKQNSVNQIMIRGNERLDEAIQHGTHAKHRDDTIFHLLSTDRIDLIQNRRLRA